jgi:hypothetical protein
MGIDPNWMKYLEWCGAAGMGTWDIDNITVNGPALENEGVVRRIGAGPGV